MSRITRTRLIGLKHDLRQQPTCLDSAGNDWKAIVCELGEEIEASWAERDEARIEAARTCQENNRLVRDMHMGGSERLNHLEAIADAAVRYVDEDRREWSATEHEKATCNLRRLADEYQAQKNADAKACVERLGIDVPKWAGEIREKVAKAEERAERKRASLSERRTQCWGEYSEISKDNDFAGPSTLLRLILDRLDDLEDE